MIVSIDGGGLEIITDVVLDIILSMTRTNRIGYLRDIRRMTVALSRSRLGLYILGRQELFEACYELKPALEKLFHRPSKLSIVTGELYPTSRLLEDERPAAEMEGVEHLGQYVFEMSQAKIADLKQNGGNLSVGEDMNGVTEGDDVDEDDLIVNEEADTEDGPTAEELQ